MTLVVWRHPRPIGAAGRCIGRTDLRVDPRRVKRLARRILMHARRHSMPREVWTSPLARCACVGRCLKRFGFIHHTSTDLLELDFGAWDGLSWDDVGREALQAWEQDFLHHAPGGGESLAQLSLRVERFVAAHARSTCLVVGHGGWINAWRWQQARPPAPATAALWPAPPLYGQRVGPL